MSRVLVVDDDEALAATVAAIVQIVDGGEVAIATAGAEAIALAAERAPDLVISDINMPDMDGLELCRRLRALPQLAGMRVLMLTARTSATDMYQGFQVGADDYLAKPFDPIELQFRIKALLRRGASAAPAAPAPPGPPLQLVPGRSMLRIDGQEIRLTKLEFAVMQELVNKLDELVDIESLLVRALDYPPRSGNPAVVHTHIRNLRTKLRDAGVDPSFLTSSRQGYMLVSDRSGGDRP